MSTSTTRARHRSARRPITPLTDLAQAATEGLAGAGRRSAVVAASSGLIVSMLTAPADAAPADTAQPGVTNFDVAALTSQARAVLEAAPAVSVSAEVAWTVEAAPVVVTPAPEPVAPPRATRTAPAASRSAERVAVAAADQAAQVAAADAAAVAAAAVPAGSQRVSGATILDIAGRYVGVPYVSGGTSPSGFDCSGFTGYVFGQAGVSLPRTSGEQRRVGTVVSRAEALPGDLVWSPGHIAIYAGGNTMIDAPRPGKSVAFREMYQSNPVFIRVS